MGKIQSRLESSDDTHNQHFISDRHRDTGDFSLGECFSIGLHDTSD
jgi:hypothetical protein